VEELLPKLAELFLGALPTALLVLLLYFFLRWSFFRPLERVLAERERLTLGTRQAAEQQLAAVEARAREYEDKLRQARAEVYREQEALRRQALEERARLLRAAREQAQQMIHQAKAQLLRDVEAARRDLQQEGERLADEITRRLLAPAARSAGGRAG
jgi:F-type H+-transporting ATPase subunit b